MSKPATQVCNPSLRISFPFRIGDKEELAIRRCYVSRCVVDRYRWMLTDMRAVATPLLACVKKFAKKLFRDICRCKLLN